MSFVELFFNPFAKDTRHFRTNWKADVSQIGFTPVVPVSPTGGWCGEKAAGSESNLLLILPAGE